MALSDAPYERLPVLSTEQLETIVDTAHAQDKLVVGQAIFSEEALTAVNAGVDELLSWPTPIESMPDVLIQAIVSRSVPIVSGFLLPHLRKVIFENSWMPVERYLMEPLLPIPEEHQ